MKNRRERQAAAKAAVNNVEKQVSQPVGKHITQEPGGTEVYTSSAFKFVWPRIDTTLIEQYADNALLAEPLKNCVELIFTSHEDHPTPWVTVKDPEGNIDDELSKQGQQIAKVCEFYPAHIRAFYDQELGGCSVWSPGWGTIEGVTGVCPVELRNLPWNSFRELPTGFMDVYNDIMPGIVLDKSTQEVRIFQKQDDRTTPIEIQQTPNLPSWIIVRDPVTPKPSGKPGCLPVLTLITNYNYADKAWNQKMNRIASPILMLQIQTALTAKIEEYAKNVVQKWGKDTGFLLTKDMLPVDPHLVESQTAEERLAWLQKRINGFYNPASFLQKDGNSIGGADTGAERLINNRTVSVLSRLENGLGEVLLNIWLNVNGFVGYSAEVRFPRPETKNDQQTLAEITEANKNGHVSRTEARQLYPNLDLPELTPEEEAKMDAEFTARQPKQQANSFSLMGAGGYGGQQSTNEIPIGNIQSPVERTEALSQVERELLEATRQCATDVKRIVREKVQSINPQKPVEVSLLQRVKNVFMPVNNADEEGSWITINGSHILIKDGETVGDAFKRQTGADLNHTGKTGYIKSMGKGESVTENAVYRARGKDNSHYAEYDAEGNRISEGKGSSFVTPTEDELSVWDQQVKIHVKGYSRQKVAFDPDTPKTDITVGGKQITVHEGEHVTDAYKAATGRSMDHTPTSGIDVRHTSSENKPQSDFGHAMFVRGDAEDRVAGAYGDVRWTYDRSQGTDITSLKSATIKAWDSDRASGLLSGEDAHISGKDAFKGFTPSDIVDGAQNWDDGPRTQWFYERVAAPKGIRAVNFGDGSVVFDKELMKRVPGYK